MSLKALRVNRELTQSQVADATGIPLNSLANYENYSTKVPIERALLLASFYGCSVDDIKWSKR